eukprot:c18988_g1_i3.p1 GENE.c18988_g1_i3~~c18988_g1_i3.p1  ORF type:complete len:147 (-),score=8.87 c18988_g1_i3:57-497(-)
MEYWPFLIATVTLASRGNCQYLQGQHDHSRPTHSHPKARDKVPSGRNPGYTTLRFVLTVVNREPQEICHTSQANGENATIFTRVKTTKKYKNSSHTREGSRQLMLALKLFDNALPVILGHFFKSQAELQTCPAAKTTMTKSICYRQ